MAAEVGGEDEATTQNTSLHCYELECAVKICSTCANEARGSIQTKNAVVTLGRNAKRMKKPSLQLSNILENRQIILQIGLTNVKGVHHVSYLLQQCKIHGRQIKQGCGSIEITSKQTAIFLSNCPSRKLNVFLKTLDAKLALLNGNNENIPRTPLSVLKKEMLAGMPTIFEKLSPLAVSEIRELRRLRNKPDDVGSLPPTSKCDAVQDGDATPRIGSKRRPLRDLRQIGKSDNGSSPPKKVTKPQDEILPRLTEEQQAVVSAVTERRRNVFFTGSAGTGKSLVLRTIIDLLPAASTFVTASTGVAASFIGGITLHSFAGIGQASGTKEQCAEIARRKGIEMQWKRCQCLIIDEISMIDAEYFEKLEYVARKVRNIDKPFGGIQLIITGDFLQLPPVTKKDQLTKFCFMCEAWRHCITETFLLRQVKRQNDPAFIEILQQVRLGRCSQRTISQLSATRFTNFESEEIVPTRLCTHTADVEVVNKERLDAIEGEEKTFMARDNFAVSESVKVNAIKRLVLKIGAQVMLMKNLDLQRGLSNGSRGTVKSFSTRGFPVVRFVASGSEGIEILPAKFQVRVPGIEEPFIRIQLPLQLAWAISIHKSQGLTLDAVEMSLSRVFADGQAYVALSRARSLNSIRLLGFDPTCIRADSKVVRFYERLSIRSEEKVASRTRVALFHDKPRSTEL